MNNKSAAQAEPPILEWQASPLVLAGLALAGIVLVFFVHEFRLTSSVILLNMAWVSIVAAGAILWKVGLYIAAGDDGDDGSFDPQTSRLDELNAEKASLLKAIKEVEFDRMMGKLSDEDASEITDVYRQRAIFILKELDEVTGTEDELSTRQQIERDLRARATLAAHGKKAAAKASSKLAKDELTVGEKALILREAKRKKVVASEETTAPVGSTTSERGQREEEE